MIISSFVFENRFIIITTELVEKVVCPTYTHEIGLTLEMIIIRKKYINHAPVLTVINAICLSSFFKLSLKN